MPLITLLRNMLLWLCIRLSFCCLFLAYFAQFQPRFYKTHNNTGNSGIGNTSAKMFITATGRALKTAKPHELSTFVIEMKGGLASNTLCLHLAVEIEGPGHSEFYTNDLGDGRIEVSYKVDQVGIYRIHVTYQGSHIKSSPFKLTVR